MDSGHIAPELSEKLIAAAGAARQNSYAPYSGFRVGAALLGQSGKIYTGCNVENASYGATICAERTALVKAVSEGERAFRAIAVVADTGEEEVPVPCGVCRQVLAEFSPEMTVIMAALTGKREIAALERLLPAPFSLSLHKTGDRRGSRL
ncbi:MAG TPA: cytidine deaminase [Firmicutes bacterium]|nr:cytidine deaminase [Bacillota bacterium]